MRRGWERPEWPGIYGSPLVLEEGGKSLWRGC